jgi:aerobic-type carbon monoxide dehydrogenase small subunit (CoxS/CutS family)
MTGNYCRCGCYVRIKAAVAQAGQQMLAARQRQEATA